MIDSIRQLETIVYSCSKCPECAACRLYSMPHFIKSDSPELMVIGINPGLPTAEQIRTFDWKTVDVVSFYETGLKACNVGKFINDIILSTLSINFDNIFFTNIIKCCTPKNREPTLDEIKNCMPYLLQQIKIIMPKTIITLGKLPSTIISNLNNVAKVKFKHLKMSHPTYYRRNGLMQDAKNLVMEFKQCQQK